MARSILLLYSFLLWFPEKTAISYPISDESAVYPAAHVEPLGVDPCVSCGGSIVEIIVCDCVVADDLDFIAIVKQVDLIAVVIAGLGAECKPSGLQSVDCTDGAFIQTLCISRKAGFKLRVKMVL